MNALELLEQITIRLYDNKYVDIGGLTDSSFHDKKEAQEVLFKLIDLATELTDCIKVMEDGV